MIAPAGPCTLIWSSKQGVDFRSRKKGDQSASKALAWNGKHPLDLCRMSGGLECRITKEGVNGGEAQVSTTYAYFLALLQIIQKCHDQWSIDLLEIQA